MVCNYVRRSHWMNVLQSCGGMFGDGEHYISKHNLPKDVSVTYKEDALLELFINRRNEAEALFGNDFDYRLRGM